MKTKLGGLEKEVTSVVPFSSLLQATVAITSIKHQECME